MMEQPQALSTDLPGLDVLFQNNPMLASMVAGKQIARADQNNQTLQEAFAAAEEQRRKERPLTLEQMTAEAGRTRAQAGLFGSQTAGNEIANKKAEGTLESDIAAGKSKNQAAMSEDEIKRAEHQGQLFGQIAAMTKGAPPMMRGQIVRRIMGDKLNQAHPELDKFLMEHADQIPQHFEAMAKASYDATAAARNEANKERAALERTKYTANTQKEINQANIDAGRWNKKLNDKAKDIVEQAKEGKIGLEKAGTTLGLMADFADSPEEAAKYRAMSEYYLAKSKEQKEAAAGVADDLKRDIIGVPKKPKTKGTGTKEDPIVLK